MSISSIASTSPTPNSNGRGLKPERERQRHDLGLGSKISVNALPRKYGKRGRYRASNPAEDDMPRPSDVAHSSNGQETHFCRLQRRRWPARAWWREFRQPDGPGHWGSHDFGLHRTLHAWQLTNLCGCGRTRGTLSAYGC